MSDCCELFVATLPFLSKLIQTQPFAATAITASTTTTTIPTYVNQSSLPLREFHSLPLLPLLLQPSNLHHS